MGFLSQRNRGGLNNVAGFCKTGNNTTFEEWEKSKEVTAMEKAKGT